MGCEPGPETPFSMLLEMETLGLQPRVTDFRICILTRCSGYLLEFEKHWYNKEACKIDTAIDTRERIYYLFLISFYCCSTAPRNQEAICVGIGKWERWRGSVMTEVEMAGKVSIQEPKKGLEIVDWIKQISSILL